MNVEIKHRWTGAILFAGEYANVRAAVAVAASQGADLRGADLRGAYLRGAYLRGADLRGAYLQGADLRDAYLRGADLQGAYLRGAYLQGAYLQGAYLQGADLQGAYLQGADLQGADLRGADLRGAYLRGAYLRGADLQGADLQGAYLRGAYLQGAKGINPYLCTPLLMLHDQPGPIRAYKVVRADGYGIWRGPNEGGICYEIGCEYEVADANCDVERECGEGIHLTTLDWCMRSWAPGFRIIIAEFEAKDIAAIPAATDGKFRVHRCKIVGEKDLVEIGLVQAETQEEQR